MRPAPISAAALAAAPIATAGPAQTFNEVGSRGTIDVECGSTTDHSDRQKQTAFATNCFYTGTRLLVKARSDKPAT